MRSLCYDLDFQFVLAGLTGGGMPSLRTLVCDFCYHLLDVCLLAQYPHVLVVEALLWFSHKGPHSKTPVPSSKSDGVFLPTSTTFTLFVGSDFCFSASMCR